MSHRLRARDFESGTSAVFQKTTLLRQGVCVCTIWIDVKLLEMSFIFFFNDAGGHQGPRGRWPTKTPPGYLWKRTCLFNPRGHFYLWQTWHGAKPRTPMQSFHKYGEGLSREPWCDDLSGFIGIYWTLHDFFILFIGYFHRQSDRVLDDIMIPLLLTWILVNERNGISDR